jgi:hypothetical protein
MPVRVLLRFIAPGAEPKKRGPFQAVLVMARAIVERLA